MISRKTFITGFITGSVIGLGTALFGASAALAGDPNAFGSWVGNATARATVATASGPTYAMTSSPSQGPTPGGAVSGSPSTDPSASTGSSSDPSDGFGAASSATATNAVGAVSAATATAGGAFGAVEAAVAAAQGAVLAETGTPLLYLVLGVLLVAIGVGVHLARRRNPVL